MTCTTCVSHLSRFVVADKRPTSDIVLLVYTCNCANAEIGIALLELIELPKVTVRGRLVILRL